ncbi:ornithine cyclodeaminase family protein [Endozoicomonas arenosclerae]|uniref:ornithine cyclodeaminase family protein n=1 Tax=Endozoicomonas arenosclerae TaxID=1633495 RepID=UPI0007821865|nr:hypothetical protein [Endozoicomonas arenosclerae]
MKIITDEHLKSFPMSLAIKAIESFFQSALQGQVITPPRHTVKAGDGGLTFTIGAELGTTHTIGFRVYDTYPNEKGTDSDQIVAVYSTNQSSLKGIVVGSSLGAIRTAAINGYAINKLAKDNVKVACLIGAGHHAKYQLEAMLAVRKPSKIIICNRTSSKAEELANFISDQYDLEVLTSENIEQSVRHSDIVLCATSASSPVIQSSWIKEGAYVSSIGPKFKGRHELPADISERASLITSDAPEQLSSYALPYFLDDISPIKPLESVRQTLNDNGYTVFLSSGRSGTEVVVADRAIQYLSSNGLIV